MAAGTKENTRRPPKKKGAGKGHRHNECQDLIDTVAAHTVCSLCGDVIFCMLITQYYIEPTGIQKNKVSSLKNIIFPKSQ